MRNHIVYLLGVLLCSASMTALANGCDGYVVSYNEEQGVINQEQQIFSVTAEEPAIVVTSLDGVIDNAFALDAFVGVYREPLVAEHTSKAVTVAGYGGRAPPLAIYTYLPMKTELTNDAQCSKIPRDGLICG